MYQLYEIKGSDKFEEYITNIKCSVIVLMVTSLKYINYIVYIKIPTYKESDESMYFKYVARYIVA